MNDDPNDRSGHRPSTDSKSHVTENPVQDEETQVPFQIIFQLPQIQVLQDFQNLGVPTQPVYQASTRSNVDVEMASPVKDQGKENTQPEPSFDGTSDLDSNSNLSVFSNQPAPNNQYAYQFPSLTQRGNQSFGFFELHFLFSVHNTLNEGCNAKPLPDVYQQPSYFNPTLDIWTANYPEEQVPIAIHNRHNQELVNASADMNAMRATADQRYQMIQRITGHHSNFLKVGFQSVRFIPHAP